MIKGDIILISFPFTDLSGSKLRPAVVLVDAPGDITTCFITTRFHRRELSDIFLRPTGVNELRRESLVRTGKMATQDKELAVSLLGRLSSTELHELNGKIKTLFQLN